MSEGTDAPVADPAEPLSQVESQQLMEITQEAPPRISWSFCSGCMRLRHKSVWLHDVVIQGPVASEEVLCCWLSCASAVSALIRKRA